MPSTLSPSIFTTEGRILSVATIAVVNPVTGFAASLTDQRSAKITFEYLNKGDGGVVELLLEGTGDLEKLQAAPDAEIIDGRKHAFQFFHGKRSKLDYAVDWFTVAVGFFLLWIAAKSSGLVVAMSVTGVFLYSEIAAAFGALLFSTSWTYLVVTRIATRANRFRIPRVIEDAMAENQMKSTVPGLNA